MQPDVILTDADYAAALARVERLMDAAPGSPQEAELEVWAVLVEKYEEEHFPIAAPDPVAAIQFRMEQSGLSRGDLLQYLPGKSKVSEVLNRKRPLSLGMIRSLHYGLKIPADVLVQEPEMERYGAAKSAKRGRAKAPGGRG